MNKYMYFAYFDRLDKTAKGIVDAATLQDAKAIVCGMSGSWCDEITDREFEAGIPDSVQIGPLSADAITERGKQFVAENDKHISGLFGIK